jgi:activating signal cointegrator complex subunit 2
LKKNDLDYFIKETMSKLMIIVLKLYYRLSLPKESEENYLSLPFYNKIVYDNWIFDMAKLVDLAAIYGKSNP